MDKKDIWILLGDEVAYPVFWSREDGSGKVVHITFGHSSLTWELEPFQHLVRQSIRWPLESK